MGKKILKSRKRREQTIAIIIVAAVVLVVTAAILIFVASQNKDLGSHDHDHDHENQAAELTLKVSVDAYEGQIHYNSAVKFAEQVESRTGGAVQVEVYPKGQLGDNASLIGALETNADVVDIVIAPVSDFTVANEKMDMSTLPFMFKDGDEAWNFLNGEIQAEIEGELLNKNIRVLSHYAGETTCILSSKKVINTAADVVSMTFTLSEESRVSNALQMMNARAITLNEQAVEQAIQQGKCDGYIATLSDIFNKRLFVQQSYLAVTNHTYEGLAFAISEDAWRNLGQYQEVVQDIAKSSAYTDRELMKQTEYDMINQIKASTVKILYPDMSTFAEKAEAYLRGYSEKYGTTLEKHLINKRMNK